MPRSRSPPALQRNCELRSACQQDEGNSSAKAPLSPPLSTLLSNSLVDFDKSTTGWKTRTGSCSSDMSRGRLSSVLHPYGIAAALLARVNGDVCIGIMAWPPRRVGTAGAFGPSWLGPCSGVRPPARGDRAGQEPGLKGRNRRTELRPHGEGARTHAVRSYERCTSVPREFTRD